MRRSLQVLYLLFGLVLLGWILTETELTEVWARVLEVRLGIAVVLAIYAVAFLLDVMAWQLTLTTVPLDGTWLVRLFRVRMVGEAVNVVTPLATVGGEPVKAILLKKRYKIGYGEGIASLVLAKTTFFLGLVIFLTFGFLLMLASGTLTDHFKVVAGGGLAAAVLGIGGLYLVQHFKATSIAGGLFLRGRLKERFEHWIDHVRHIEDRLVRFYTQERHRFAAAVFLSLVNWILGAVEVYATFWFLGTPLSWTDAWIIEAVAQLVRLGTFFIPASLGAQEGAFILLTQAITGDATLGFAAALVRRCRELVWVALGYGVGGAYAFHPSLAARELSDSP